MTQPQTGQNSPKPRPESSPSRLMPRPTKGTNSALPHTTPTTLRNTQAKFKCRFTRNTSSSSLFQQISALILSPPTSGVFLGTIQTTTNARQQDSSSKIQTQQPLVHGKSLAPRQRTSNSTSTVFLRDLQNSM